MDTDQLYTNSIREEYSSTLELTWLRCKTSEFSVDAQKYTEIIKK
jgi:hypothetical protein